MVTTNLVNTLLVLPIVMPPPSELLLFIVMPVVVTSAKVVEKLNNKGSMGFGVVSSADVSSSVTGNFMMPYVVFKEKVEGGGMPKNIQMRNTTGVRYIEMDFEPDGNYIHFKCTSVSSKDYGASVYVY